MIFDVIMFVLGSFACTFNLQAQHYILAFFTFHCAVSHLYNIFLNISEITKIFLEIDEK